MDRPETDSLTITARDFGLLNAGDPNQEPVVFLHGWGGSKDIWQSVLARCPKDFYYLALDLPGTGQTPTLAEYDPDTLTGWLLGVLDTLGLDRVSLVGHSMGGNFCAQFALRAPERVRSLIAVNAALFSDRLPQAKHYIAPFYGDPLLRAAWLGSGLLGAIDLLHPERDSGGFWRPFFRRSRYFQQHNSVAGMQTQLTALINHPVEMPSLSPDLPVLIIHGALDATVPIAHSEEAAVLRPKNTTLVAYDDAYHCPMDEFPTRFLDDLTAFLREIARTPTDASAKADPPSL